MALTTEKEILQPLSRRLDITPESEISGIEPTRRWIRGFVGDQIAINSKRVKILWIKDRKIPVYCFPKQDIQTSVLNLKANSKQKNLLGEISFFDIENDNKHIEKAALEFTQPPSEWEELEGYVFIEWSAIDRWFEEEEQVFVHLRDPYHRVDALRSSRKVKVVLAGLTLAETKRALFLYETGFPTRFYIPKEDIFMNLLNPSERITQCPYKGTASYWSATIENQNFSNIAWEYPDPVDDCLKIKEFVCFFNEYVDAIYIDQEQEIKPNTVWSKKIRSKK